MLSLKRSVPWFQPKPAYVSNIRVECLKHRALRFETFHSWIVEPLGLRWNSINLIPVKILYIR